MERNNKQVSKQSFTTKIAEILSSRQPRNQPRANPNRTSVINPNAGNTIGILPYPTTALLEGRLLIPGDRNACLSYFQWMALANSKAARFSLYIEQRSRSLDGMHILCAKVLLTTSARADYPFSPIFFVCNVSNKALYNLTPYINQMLLSCRFCRLLRHARLPGTFENIQVTDVGQLYQAISNSGKAIPNPSRFLLIILTVDKHNLT